MADAQTTQSSETVMEENQTPELTPEEIEHWLNEKGSIPRAIRSQIASIRRKNKLAKTNKIYKETSKGIVQRDKLELFLKEFVQNGGNATQAALTIGNYSTIQSASVAGHNFLKRAKGLSRIYLEKRGYTYGKLLDIATQKMETSKTPDWWDRIMKMADYADFISKREERPSVVNIVQAQRDLQKAFGFGEIIDGEEANGDTNDQEEL